MYTQPLLPSTESFRGGLVGESGAAQKDSASFDTCPHSLVASKITASQFTGRLGGVEGPGEGAVAMALPLGGVTAAEGQW